MIILTHKARQSAINAALAEIEKLPECCGKPVLFRIEDVD